MRSFFYTSLAFIIWSTWVIPVRLLGYNSYTISFYLCFFATLLWCGINFFSKKNLSLKRNELFGLIILSTLFVGNLITYLLSLNLTHSSIAVITHYTAPIFVAILAPLLLKEKLTKITIIALISSFFGFLIIFFKKNVLVTLDIGAIFGLSSGFFYGLSIITARKLLKTLDSETLIFYQNLFSTIILLIFFDKIDFSFKQELIIKMIFLSLFYSGIASYLYLYGLFRLGGVKTSIIGYLEPVGTIFWGWLVFYEVLTIKVLVGGFLVLFSGYLVTRYDKINVS